MRGIFVYLYIFRLENIMTLSAKEFFDAWVDVYSEKDHQEKLNFYWSNRSAYTKEIANVCVDIAQKLYLECWTDNYYFIDHVFYKAEGAEEINGTTYIINPEIVFEHENDTNGFYTEVAHHLMLKSNLYVVVSYYKNIVNEIYMDKIRALINKSNNASELKEKQNFLIILGEEDAADISKDYWKGFIFNGDNWNEVIQEKSVQY